MIQKKHYDAIVVLGGIFEGRNELERNPLMRLRVEAAIALYKTGYGDYVLVSGGSQEVSDYIKQKTNIPDEKLIVTPEENETAPSNTVENFIEIPEKLKKFGSVRNILILTSGYHVSRSRYIGRLLPKEYNVDYVGVESGLTLKQLSKAIFNEVQDILLTGMLLWPYNSNSRERAGQIMHKLYEDLKPLIRIRTRFTFGA
jgi:uncharacterized SAM-binding protein YcdF (DUF218 family)